MTQSRARSLRETLTSTALGYLVALASQLLVFPMFGIDIPLHYNLGIGAWFTAISVTRQYFVRRWFNSHEEKGLDCRGTYRVFPTQEEALAFSEGLRPIKSVEIDWTDEPDRPGRVEYLVEDWASDNRLSEPPYPRPAPPAMPPESPKLRNVRYWPWGSVRKPGRVPSNPCPTPCPVLRPYQGATLWDESHLYPSPEPEDWKEISAHFNRVLGEVPGGTVMSLEDLEDELVDITCRAFGVPRHILVGYPEYPGWPIQ